jgi:hypothetical protein
VARPPRTRRERILEPCRQLVGRCGWQARLQFVVQVVSPGSHRVGDALLDALDVGRDAARRVRAHENVETCKGRLGNLHL